MTPKYRFSEFVEPVSSAPLSSFITVNPDRNRALLYSKDDVLSVSGELGIVNQIELLGRSFAGESVAEYHIVESNDIVYTKSPLKANPYGIVKCNKGKTGIVSTLYAVYHCKNNTNPLFIDYYFAYDNRLNRYLKPLVRIGAKHDMKIGNEEVLVGMVCFPSFAEQQKIVDFLTVYDEKVALQQQKVEALGRRKKGLLQKVFSQEIRFKADDGSEFPEWERTTLDSISSRVKRKNTNNVSNLPLTISAEYGLIDQLDFFDKKIAAKDMSGYYLLQNGEFAYNKSTSKDAPVGAIKRLDRYPMGVVSTLYICFALKADVNSDFMVHYFESSIWHNEVQLICAEGARNHGLLNIPIEGFFGISITLPTKNEQQKIADFFSAIDEQIEVEKKRLESMQTIKKGLLQQMFCDGSEE